MLIVFFLVKEGSGLSLEMIQTMYDDPVVVRLFSRLVLSLDLLSSLITFLAVALQAWRSDKWVPPGYSSRDGAAEASKTRAVPGTIGEDDEHRPSMQETVVGENEKRKKTLGAQAQHVETPSRV